MFQGNIYQNPNTFIQENVFEYAIWNGNHLFSTEMRFNDCVQYVHWKVLNKGERNTWYTFESPLISVLLLFVSILNFTGQLMNKI